MKRNEKISLVSTIFFLFSFLFFVVTAQAKSLVVVNQVAMESGNCIQITKNIKVTLNKVKVIYKGMQNTLKSDQPIDKYNRHVNILLGNLEVRSIRLSKLLGNAEQSGCPVGEYAAILLAATLGAMLLCGSTDLVSVFVSLETLSVASYLLSSFIYRYGNFN